LSAARRKPRRSLPRRRRRRTDKTRSFFVSRTRLAAFFLPLRRAGIVRTPVPDTTPALLRTAPQELRVALRPGTPFSMNQGNLRSLIPG
jgi:hypothetical protein